MSVSLEQNQALATLHTTLREALLQLLLSGNISVTRHIVESVWGPLPAPPLIALVGIPQQFDSSGLMPALESVHAAEDIPFFFAQYRGDAALLVAEEHATRLVEELSPFAFALGQSLCNRWEGLELALEEASKAAEFGMRRGTMGVTAFPEIWRDGVTDLIDTSNAAHVARRLLGPLARSAPSHEVSLLDTLRVWLKYHGRQLPASRELGIHRHTLSNRLEQIATLTGADLDDFQARAELAVALRYYQG
ncbi:PucR family transcriptional regulator [Leucobacter insecticola]|uniref:PucR family transcriptional regulator n=1 Tax=Leucobacter insecticola TaxID=2714934 RepID=A0A6G8FIT8_9MICO|nr:PucR family transcriptional regulator [Leucobacter insecticola]QIM16287.1 PucR family transcriptional regulator [Leucobacter insecticola]